MLVPDQVIDATFVILCLAREHLLLRQVFILGNFQLMDSFSQLGCLNFKLFLHQVDLAQLCIELLDLALLPLSLQLGLCNLFVQLPILTVSHLEGAYFGECFIRLRLHLTLLPYRVVEFKLCLPQFIHHLLVGTLQVT